MVLAVEPRLEPLRGNPNFQELLAKSRLPLLKSHSLSR